MLKLVILLLTIFTLVNSENPVYRVKNLERNPRSVTADLVLERGRGPFGSDILELKLEIHMETKTRVHFKITDKKTKRWEVPKYILENTKMDENVAEFDYTVAISDPFGIVIKRKSDGEVLFDSTNQKFVFSNQYLTITTKLPSDNPNIYGLGERVTNFRLDPKNKYYAMWSIDRYAQEAKHLYGVHPFYIEKRKEKAHGVFLLNSNAQNVQIRPHHVTFRTIGGVLDFYVFSGPTPDDVTRQYQQLVGKPFIPPYWGLGWHQCRYGYKDIQTTREVWENYRKHNIPLDTIWNDIDYMDAYKLYTWEPKHYPLPEVQKFVKQLHENDQKYVVIVDPGVKVERGYHCYEEGLKRGIYITQADGKTPIVNKVWPGYTVFPDFSLNKTQQYWTDLIKQFLDEVPIDGLWIDMNEVACFCDGACGPDQAIGKVTNQLTANYNHPPYVPFDHKMYFKTLYMDAKTDVGIEYNTHSLYGFFETVQTHKSLVDITKKRPFIITRSSFPGTGRMAGKWTGDNQSTWSDLFYSISGMLTSNILGIPLIGADVCGFEKEATEELCVRWHQLGSFYPFARNHNAIKMRDQEPWTFGPLLIETTRDALMNRYSLLPYYYSLFYDVHIHGGTVIKSLPFEFNKDTMNVIDHIDRQFLVGSGLLVSPVLDQGATTVSVYFPETTWYDYYTGVKLAKNGWQVIPAGIKTIPVHIRGGYIIPRQQPALTTTATSKNPFFLNVALHEGNASGELYLDDGESLDSVSAKKYTHIKYVASNGVLRSQINHGGYDVSSKKLNNLSIYGAPNTCSVKVNGRSINSFRYNRETQVLLITDLDLSMASPFSIEYNC